MKKELILCMAIIALLSGCQMTRESASAVSEMEQQTNIAVVNDASYPAQRSDLAQNESRQAPTGKFTVRELSCERDGLVIRGIAHIPEGMDEKVPTVIMSHGFNASYTSNIEYAESLAEVGIASYAFDFCGGSTGSVSDGSMLEMSVLTEVADLNAVIDFVETLDFVDKGNLFLMGRSQGGFVPALAAAQRADEIRGMVLFYPAFVIQSNARDAYPDASKIPEQATVLGATVGRRYYKDALTLDFQSDIQGYTNDVLILHGDRDSLVPLSYSEEAVKAYASAELVVLKGAGHGFYDSDAAYASDAIISFIEGHSSTE